MVLPKLEVTTGVSWGLYPWANICKWMQVVLWVSQSKVCSTHFQLLIKPPPKKKSHHGCNTISEANQLLGRLLGEERQWPVWNPKLLESWVPILKHRAWEKLSVELDRAEPNHDKLVALWKVHANSIIRLSLSSQNTSLILFSSSMCVIKAFFPHKGILSQATEAQFLEVFSTWMRIVRIEIGGGLKQGTGHHTWQGFSK